MDITELTKLCLENNRDLELETKAWKNNDYYYFRPSVAEINSNELEKLQNDCLRVNCNQEGMNDYYTKAKALIRAFAEAKHRDYDVEEKLFLNSHRTLWGERVWLSEKVKALWW